MSCNVASSKDNALTYGTWIASIYRFPLHTFPLPYEIIQKIALYFVNMIAQNNVCNFRFSNSIGPKLQQITLNKSSTFLTFFQISKCFAKVMLELPESLAEGQFLSDDAKLILYKIWKQYFWQEVYPDLWQILLINMPQRLSSTCLLLKEGVCQLISPANETWIETCQKRPQLAVNFLAKLPQVNPDYNYGEALANAVKENNTVAVKLFLSLENIHPQIENEEKEKSYILVEAAEKGFDDIVKLFIVDGRASPQDNRHKAIACAAVNDHMKRIDVLLGHFKVDFRQLPEDIRYWKERVFIEARGYGEDFDAACSAFDFRLKALNSIVQTFLQNMRKSTHIIL